MTCLTSVPQLTLTSTGRDIPGYVLHTCSSKFVCLLHYSGLLLYFTWRSPSQRHLGYNRVIQKGGRWIWSICMLQWIQTLCSVCKDLSNSVAECKSICAALGQEWSWTSWMFSVPELVRRIGFTLFNKPWKQLTNPFSPLRNCREMEHLVIHSSPSSSWWLFIWQNSLSVHWPRWIILTPCCWMSSDLPRATTVTVLLF